MKNTNRYNRSETLIERWFSYLSGSNSSNPSVHLNHAIDNAMKALTVRGSFNGTSGHDHHVREFVRQLYRQGLDVQLVDFADWAPGSLPDHVRDPWFDTLNEPVDSEVLLHFCMPHQVRPARDMLNVNFTMFEATRVPRKWVKCALQHDLIILPTESSKRAWVESGCPEERIRLCPLGVDPEVFRPDVEPLPLADDQGKRIGDYRVKVLHISDLTPRKNLLGLLRVWMRSTRRSDDAVLVVKLSCGSRKWLKKFMRSVAKMEKALGKTRAESAPIVWLTNQTFSDVKMPRLYAAATHYWSMSRGEGWDQPMMEAGAMGLNLIAPWHSAYTAYLDESIAHLIPARQEPAVFRWSDGLHKLFRGADWWEPEEDAAGEIIRKIVQVSCDGKNLSARERIVNGFTWEKATRRLIEILDEFQGR